MHSLRRLAVAGLAAGLALMGFGPSAGAATIGPYVCAGGAIPSGTYSSLVVDGTCLLNGGQVTVLGGAAVEPGGILLGAFHAGSLMAKGAFSAGAGAIVVLGCEPFAFPCLDDPSAVPTPFGLTGGTESSRSEVASFSAAGSLAVLLHNDNVKGDLGITGGGGGASCVPTSLGFPNYATVEDLSIGGSASIAGMQTCWLGFIRNAVMGSVQFTNNVLADADGNEVVTNTVGGSLLCSGNDPAPQVGDSGGSLNTVRGRALGQCSSLAG